VTGWRTDAELPKSDRDFRAGFRLKLVKMFRADFGSAYKIFSQRMTLMSLVPIEAVEFIKSSIKNDYL